MHPYKLVKDLRTNEEKTDVQSVLNGEIDSFIKAYLMNLKIIMYKIIHNPRCRKSREVLKFLQKIKTQILEYLKEPLDKESTKEIISLLSDDDLERVLRKNELVYKKNYKNKVLNKEELVNAIYDNPILIERPIIFNEKVAIIARPKENILDLLKQ